MCGVIGFYTRRLEEQHLSLLMRLIQQSKIRGLHAFGVSFYDDHIVTRKQFDPPTEGFLEEFRERRRGREGMLIYHNRYSTSGDWWDMRNNQPVVVGDVAVALNGVVTMSPQEEWTERYGVGGFETENDTEILVRLIIRDGLRRVAAEIMEGRLGSVAMVALYRGQVWAFRNYARPLWWFVENGGVYVVSTRDIAERAHVRERLHSLRPGVTFKLRLGEEDELLHRYRL